jgi:hypothetical protein
LRVKRIRKKVNKRNTEIAIVCIRTYAEYPPRKRNTVVIAIKANGRPSSAPRLLAYERNSSTKAVKERMKSIAWTKTSQPSPPVVANVNPTKKGYKGSLTQKYSSSIVPLNMDNPELMYCQPSYVTLILSCKKTKAINPNKKSM